MLLSIKSLDIINLIFSYVDEKRKLILILYNKKLQNKLDITINNYKNISKRYKIGERNGLGKEYYYYGDLFYEGEYLNGKRSGKGKEYYKEGKLKFEGEYLNGERNGKGKEYNYDGKLKFEGEYLNGKRNGNNNL